MKICEVTNEAFGRGVSPKFDLETMPLTRREKFGTFVGTIASIVGAVAGYNLTPEGFWGTTGGVLAGIFLGASVEPLVRGSKDNNIRIKKANELANSLVINQGTQLQTDFSVFVKSLFADTPKQLLNPEIVKQHVKDVEGWYNQVAAAANVKSLIRTGAKTNEPGPEDTELAIGEKERELAKFVTPWLAHYSIEWEALAKKYNVSYIVLGIAFEIMYKKPVMEVWIDLLNKKFDLYNPPYQTPFTGGNK